MKFKLNDRVIWKDTNHPPHTHQSLKGTIINLITITDLITEGLTHFITIKWDNDVTIDYTNYNINFNVEIDIAYQRDKILNELGI